MQVAAHRPEKIVAAARQGEFLPRYQSRLDQRFVRIDPAEIFADPEQRLQVALPALPFLHLRLDEVARLADARMPPVALGKFCGDEVARRAGNQLLVEAARSEEHTSELQSRLHLVCRLLLEKKKTNRSKTQNH